MTGIPTVAHARILLVSSGIGVRTGRHDRKNQSVRSRRNERAGVRFETRFDYYALACGALALCGAAVAAYGMFADATATIVGGSVLVGGAGAALQLGVARRDADEG